MVAVELIGGKGKGPLLQLTLGDVVLGENNVLHRDTAGTTDPRILEETRGFLLNSLENSVLLSSVVRERTFG